MNLYQMTATQHAMGAMLAAQGFDEQTIADTLEAEQNTDALRDKRLGYIAIIKHKRIAAAARNSAAAAINQLAERDTMDADRLETALFKSMTATGDADLVGLEFEAHIKGKPAAVVIKDVSKVPAIYMRIPAPKAQDAVPDKAEIKAALQRGDLVDGCELGASKKLVIL